jgi:competence protein ComEC
MSHRPLIPALLSLSAGILMGRITLPYYQTLIFPLFILITLSLITSLIVSSISRRYLFLTIFFFVGLLLILNTKGHSDLLQPAQERKKVVLEGTLLSPSRITRDKITRLEVKARNLLTEHKVKTIDEKVSVTAYGDPVYFLPGQRIRFPATLRTFNNFNNPGSYNYRLSMELKGFSCSASVSDGRYIVPMGKGSLGFPLDMIEKVRRPIRDFLVRKLAEPKQGLYSALILGERQGIDPELRERFNITGLGHILAVSGLHIGLIAWLSFSLLRWLMSLSYRLTLWIDIRKAAAVMTCFPVIAYACMAGFQVSTQRAMIMVLIFLFSIIIGREKETWSTLAFAAFMVLVIDPDAIFSISFQLSFVAVIGILWFVPGIIKRIPDPFASSGRQNILSRIYLYVSGLIVVTLCAAVFLMPFTTFYFHRISLVTIPANLMTVPLLGLWILPLGLLSCLTLYVSPLLAEFMIELGSWGLAGMIRIIGFWSNLDWASFWAVTPNIFEIILFYGIIFFAYFIKGRPWAKVGLAILIVICCVDISYWIYETRLNPHLRVTYLDVGQGNSALIQFPGKKRMLIDGGGFQMSSFDAGRMVVAPFLFHSKILRVDYIVLSHPHHDHMNGLLFVASNFSPEEFWHNGDSVDTPEYHKLMEIIESNRIKTLLPCDLSEERDISGVKIRLLHPSNLMKQVGVSSYDDRDLNNNSLVLKIIYHGTSLLFPGDIETETEESLDSSMGTALNSDIMLAPHHGSKTSSTGPFLKAVRPEICVISSGKGNRFGLPHSETIKRLEHVGCEIIRIDESGAVRFIISEEQYKIKCFLE